MKKTLVSIISVFVFACSHAQIIESQVNSSDTVVMAPLFSAETLEGKMIDLQSLRGQVVVLNMWYTGCLPCIKEMPELNKLSEKFKDKAVSFLAINWDDKEETKNFLKKYPFSFQIIPGRNDIIRKQYMGKHLVFPTTYVIDQKGVVRKVFSGADKLEEITALLNNLITTKDQQKPVKSYPIKS